MESSGLNDPLQEALAKSQKEVLTKVESLLQEVMKVNASSVADLKGDIAGVNKDIAVSDARLRGDSDRMRDQIHQLAESKFWKVLYLVLPILLGCFIWWLQIGTNQKIDAESKKLATRLALTEEFYKNKLSVYQDADKQMAVVIGCMEDLRLDPSDVKERKLAVDNLRKLSEMSKTNGLYMSKDVSEGLAGLSYAAAESPLLGGRPATNLKTLADRVDSIEGLMKKELNEFGSLE